MKYKECMFSDCFNSVLSLFCLALVIATFSFPILYIMTSQASLRLSSRLSQFKCCNMFTKCVSLSVGDKHCNHGHFELIDFPFTVMLPGRTIILL
jgi:hypothetical protein